MSVAAFPALSGVLFVNKPSGPTSFDLIRWLRRSFPKLKVGHAGTLDPLASGLMILLVGNATKQQGSFMKLDKTYHCRLRFGVRTDTGDRVGKVVEEKPVPSWSEADIDTALRSFIGRQAQIPPMYAAIKKDGTPLYKMARKGIVIDRQPREIEIYSLDRLSPLSENLLEIRVRCTSGTYVRSLAEDLGVKLGTVATVDALERESVGPYTLTAAIPAEALGAATPEMMQGWLKQLGSL